ncbi:MAG: hypothetical protein ACFFD4_31635 [Candidatus Odinarchaeota archaeon]
MVFSEMFGFKYPDNMAPLEREYRKYDVYAKLSITSMVFIPLIILITAIFFAFVGIVQGNDYYYEPNTSTYLAGIIFILLFIFYIIPLSWWAVPLTLIYSFYMKDKLIDKTVKKLVYSLIIDSGTNDFHGIKKKTNISNSMFRKAVNALIAEGELIGKISNNVFVPAGDISKEVQTKLSERQINRFKGMLKIRRQVTIDEMAQLFNSPEHEIELMLYEIVGAGKVNLMIKEGIVCIPEEQDVDSTINDLDAAFAQWEMNVEKKVAKL